MLRCGREIISLYLPRFCNDLPCFSPVQIVLVFSGSNAETCKPITISRVHWALWAKWQNGKRPQGPKFSEKGQV